MVSLKEKRLLSGFLPSVRLHRRSLIIPHSSESRLPGVKGGWGSLHQRLSLWELNMKIIREIATSGQILLSFPWYPNESCLPRKLSKKRSREWRGFLPSTWHLSCLEGVSESLNKNPAVGGMNAYSIIRATTAWREKLEKWEKVELLSHLNLSALNAACTDCISLLQAPSPTHPVSENPSWGKNSKLFASTVWIWSLRTVQSEEQHTWCLIGNKNSKVFTWLKYSTSCLALSDISHPFTEVAVEAMLTWWLTICYWHLSKTNFFAK